MSDRVVDECNPDSHVTMKDLSSLCFDDLDEGEAKDWSCVKDNYRDSVLQIVLQKYGTSFNKQPFQHESLLIDRKDKQLSKQEKRLAKKGYEREKQASRAPTLAAGARSHRPVASVRPMLQGGERPSRWIPAEHWQRQGMTAQEMTLPLDVVIPTNQPDKSNIILKAGQKVLVLKSPKGVYMQLENGKIVAIKTAIKVRGKAEEDAAKMMKPFPPMKPPHPPLPPPNMPLLPPKRMVRPFTPGHTKLNVRSIRQPVPNLVARMQGAPRMQGASRVTSGQRMPPILQHKPSPPKPSSLQMGTESSQMNPTKLDTENKKLQLPNELSQRLMGDEITMEKYSPKTERRAQTKDVPQQPTSVLKNLQQRGGNTTSSLKSQGSTIHQLEQSTSTLISETKQRIQDISEMTNSFQEEEKASASDSSSVAPIESDDMQDPEDAEDIEELEEGYEDEEGNEVGDSDLHQDEVEGKDDGSQNQEYGYGGYYGYNQPYPHHPPQPYGSYPPHQPPPYDYVYGQPQQPPYNYNMYPQGYHPPQAQYPVPPPQPYDPFAAHPPQPMYAGYHPPYPQQYPPPPNYLPAGAPTHNYPDYQYNSTTAPSQNSPQSSNPNYFQST